MPYLVLFLASALAAILPQSNGEAASSLSSPLSKLFRRRLIKGGIRGLGPDFSNEILDFSVNARKDISLELQGDLSSGFGGGLDRGIGIRGGLDHGGGGGFANEFAYTCKEGEVLNVDGKCAQPLVSKNVFVYDAPPIEPIVSPPPQVPRPKVDFNIVFVRTPKKPKDLDPIVVPPPHQKTLVYVLSQKPLLEQDIIELPPGPPQIPEVFYINYNKGDNPSLPGGVNLQEVLASLKQQQAKLLGGDLGKQGALTYGENDAGFGNLLGDKFIAQDAPGIYSPPSSVPSLLPTQPLTYPKSTSHKV